MLGCEPIVHREHLDSAQGGDAPARAVVRIQIAEDPCPSVHEYQHRTRLAVPVAAQRQPAGSGEVFHERQLWPLGPLPVATAGLLAHFCQVGNRHGRHSCITAPRTRMPDAAVEPSAVVRSTP